MAAALLFLALALAPFAQGQYDCFDPACYICSTTDPHDCTTCYGGYVMDSEGYCVDAQCEGGDTHGYYWNTTNVECTQCSGWDMGCLDCYNTNVCYDCKSRFTINNNDVCVACPPHASYCYYDITNTLRVDECDEHFYVNAAGTECTPCPTLAHCASCYSATECDSCDEGFGPNDASVCQACPDNCNECWYSPYYTYDVYCSVCADGYSRDNGGSVCTPNHCSAAYCASVGQLLLPGANGYDCDGPCRPWDCCGGVTGDFIGVYFYYEMIGYTDLCAEYNDLEIFAAPNTDCFPISYYPANYGKVTCNGDGTYTVREYNNNLCSGTSTASTNYDAGTCNANPAGSNGDGVVVSCPDTPRCSSTCQKCENHMCTMCPEGMYATGSSCGQCADGCTVCLASSSAACLACEDGYYFDGNGHCMPCMDGCLDCTAGNTCSYCFPFYFYTAADTSCVACGANCFSCNSGGCLSCVSDYWNNNGNCQACPNNCTSCSSTNGQCTNCDQGFRVNNGQCTACGTGCLECTSTGCYSYACDDGFTYNSTTQACDRCSDQIPGCRSCEYVTGGLYCIDCMEGQGFRNMPQTCASCSGSWNCDQCLPYYYNPNTGCYNCPNNYYINEENTCDEYNTGAGVMGAPSFLAVAALALLAWARE